MEIVIGIGVDMMDLAVSLIMVIGMMGINTIGAGAKVVALVAANTAGHRMKIMVGIVMFMMITVVTSTAAARNKNFEMTMINMSTMARVPRTIIVPTITMSSLVEKI